MLKLLALIFMLIDHIAVFFAFLLPSSCYYVMRTIGRLAFPIFAFMLAMGFRKTSNRLFYFFRLLGFAVGSEIIFRFFAQKHAISLPSLNIFFTLALGLINLSALELSFYSFRDVIAQLHPLPSGESHLTPPLFHAKINPGKVNFDPHLGLILGILTLIVATTLSHIFHVEYGIYGQCYIIIFYLALELKPNHNSRLSFPTQQMAFSLLWLAFLNIFHVFYEIVSNHANTLWTLLQSFSIFAACLCFALTKKRTSPEKKWQRYFFYIFFPAHILLLGLIRYLFFT